jgi:hypothetical protein
LLPDVLVETVVFEGLSLVTAVRDPARRLEVVHVTEEGQVEKPLAIVQEVAESVPEGVAQVLPFQPVPEVQTGVTLTVLIGLMLFPCSKLYVFGVLY